MQLAALGTLPSKVQPFNDYNDTEVRKPFKTHKTPLRNCSTDGFTHVPKQPKSLISSGFRAWKKSAVILSKLRWTFGGGEGNRTPVRKPVHRSFSERRRSFAFPRADGGRQSSALGSFMMHGTGKAYRTHGRH